jgi:hypothetical protein
VLCSRGFRSSVLSNMPLVRRIVGGRFQWATLLTGAAGAGAYTAPGSRRSARAALAALGPVRLADRAIGLGFPDTETFRGRRNRTLRDPELVAAAQHAAARLEAAWERWRTLQGVGEGPAQPVVGYVG